MEERLHYLFKQYLANTCTRLELEEFFALIRTAEHDDQLRQLVRKVYNELKPGTSQGTYVDENGNLVLVDVEPTEHAVEHSMSKTARYTRPVVVAFLVVAVTSLCIFQATRRQAGHSSSLSELTRKTTNRSESKYLLLEDSTRVWLNAASSLEYPDKFEKEKREVYLSGEAYFDVMHADKIPFIIHTGEVSTTVLGTAFNIKAYPDQHSITIAVSRGKVKVSRGDGWEKTLVKGQQLRLNDEGPLTPEKNIQTENVAAWQQGNLSYEDETMADIVADLQRVYNVDIRIDSKTLQTVRMTTSFKRDIGVAQALQVLCKLTDSGLKLKDGIYIIQ